MSGRIVRAFEGLPAFLDRPSLLWTRPVLDASPSSRFAIGLTLPLWRIGMEAPQYPNGLTVDICPYKLESGHEGNDLREINILEFSSA